MNISLVQTLADETRLNILEILKNGERTVNDITDSVDIRQSGVSRHLRILQEAGFVRVRPEGQKRFYALQPEPFRELDTWIAGYRKFWEARLDRFALVLQEKQTSQRSHLKPRKQKEIAR